MNRRELNLFEKLNKQFELETEKISDIIEDDDRFKKYPHIKYGTQDIHRWYTCTESYVKDEELVMIYTDRDNEDIYITFPIEILINNNKKGIIDAKLKILFYEQAKEKEEAEKRKLQRQRMCDEADFNRLKEKLGK